MESGAAAATEKEPIAGRRIDYLRSATMADPYERALGRGCLTGLLGQVAAVAIAVAFFLAAGAVATLGRELGLPQAAIPAVAGGFVLLFIATFTAAAFAFAAHRAARFDPAFGRVGLRGKALGLNGRQYHGNVHGRRVDAYFHRRGGVLQIWIDTSVRTKLAIGTRSRAGTALGDLLGLTELELSDHEYRDFIASSDDRPWGAQVFSQPIVKAHLLALLRDPAGREMRSLALRPAGLVYTRRWVTQLDPDEVTRSFDALMAFLTAVESLGPPATAQTPSALESRMRSNPGAMGVVIAVLLLVVLGGAGLIFTLAMLALTWDSGSGHPPPGKPAVHRRR